MRRDLMRAEVLLRDEHLEFHPSEHCARTVGDIIRHMISQEQRRIHFAIRVRCLPGPLGGRISPASPI